MMKLTSLMMEDTEDDTRVQDARALAPEDRAITTHSDFDAPRITAHGRRLRRWLIVGNIVAWILLILAGLVIFF
jgi:hypothetical protein